MVPRSTGAAWRGERMAQESTGSEQTRGAAVWIIVERIRGAVLGNDLT